jgi:hypothetical protein
MQLSGGLPEAHLEARFAEALKEEDPTWWTVVAVEPAFETAAVVTLD